MLETPKSFKYDIHRENFEDWAISRQLVQSLNILYESPQRLNAAHPNRLRRVMIKSGLQHILNVVSES